MKFSQATLLRLAESQEISSFFLKALEWDIWTDLSHLGVKQETWWQIFLYQFSVVLRVWHIFCIFSLHFDCYLQKNSCVLPEDLKNFYLMTDGFQMTWSVKTDGESLCSPPLASSIHCSQSFFCRTSLISNLISAQSIHISQDKIYCLYILASHKRGAYALSFLQETNYSWHKFCSVIHWPSVDTQI